MGAALVCSAVMLVGCGTSKPAGNPSVSGTQPAEKPGLKLDESKTVEQPIKAAEGGSIQLLTAQGDLIRITFPQDSLKADATIQVTPITQAPVEGEILVPGFLLKDKATGKGPELQFPALLTFAVPKALSPTTSLVRYKDDGSGYDVVSTTVASKSGVTELVAQVTGFSAYGAMNLTQKQVDQAKEAQRTEARYNWVIYVKDTSDVPGAPIKQSITVNLKASNTSGGMLGSYKGTATAKTTNDGSVGGGELKATASSNSSALEFNLAPALAPLAPAGDGSGLAPLTKGSPDFTGSGTISMGTTGKATVTGKGRSVSGPFSNSSTVPIEVNVSGPLVRLSVQFPEGTVYFNGYMRGEGKK